jgi:hypothetical protein
MAAASPNAVARIPSDDDLDPLGSHTVQVTKPLKDIRQMNYLYSEKEIGKPIRSFSHSGMFTNFTCPATPLHRISIVLARASMRAALSPGNPLLLTRRGSLDSASDFRSALRSSRVVGAGADRTARTPGWPMASTRPRRRPPAGHRNRRALLAEIRSGGQTMGAVKLGLMEPEMPRV